MSRCPDCNGPMETIDGAAQCPRCREHPCKAASSDEIVELQLAENDIDASTIAQPAEANETRFVQASSPADDAKVNAELPTADELISQLRRLRLIDAAELEAFLDSPSRAAAGASARSMAQALVAAQLLTEFQAEQALAGSAARLVLGDGRYVLVDHIAKGGMGAVYRARQVQMDRTVALKVAHEHKGKQEEVLDRFRREVAASAKLNHPNLIQAFDVVQSGDSIGLVLEYVNGPNLQQVVRKHGPLPIPVACDLVRQAALGLAEAHALGMVHRDIKPSNLLLAPRRKGTASASWGTVKVLDLGLVRLESERATPPSGSPGLPRPSDRDNAESPSSKIAERVVWSSAQFGTGFDTLTGAGTIMGTLDFMAPEQGASSHAVDARADLYSLGATLYFLLSGKPPLGLEGTVAEKLHRMQSVTPKPLSEVRGDCPAALSALVCQLLAKHREERPASAEIVAERLTKFVEPATEAPALDLPDWLPAPDATTSIRALTQRLQGPKFNFRAWARSNAPFAGVFVAVAAAFVLLWHGYGWWERSRRAVLVIDWPEHERTGGEMLVNNRPINVPATGSITLVPGLGRFEIQLSRPGYHPIVTDVSLKAGSREEFRPTWEMLPELSRAEELKVLVNDARGGRALSPDHSDLEKLRDRLFDFQRRHAGALESVRVAELLYDLPSPLDLLDPKDLPAYAQRDAEKCPAIVAAIGDARLKHWSGVTSVAFSPDNAVLASGSYDWTVKLWNAQSGHEIRTLYGHGGPVYAVAYSPDGKLLASSGADGAIKMWDLKNGQEMRTLSGHAGRVRCLAFHPIDGRLASGGEDRTVKIWDPRTGKELQTLTGHAGAVYSVAFRRDGQFLASGDSANTALVWDKNGHRFGDQITIGAKGYAVFATFTHDGRLTVGGGGKHAICNLDGLLKPSETAAAVSTYYCGSSTDGQRLATADNGGVFVYDIATWKEENRRGLSDVMGAVAYSPDGKQLSVGGANSYRVFLLQSPTLNDVTATSDHRTCTTRTAFSPDGRILASGSNDGQVICWDPINRTKVHSHGGQGIVLDLAFSRIAPVLAAGSVSAVSVWDYKTGQSLRTINVAGSAPALVFIASTDMLAIGESSGAVRLWESSSGSLLRSLPTPSGNFYNLDFMSLALNPTSDRILVASNTGGSVNTTLWNSRTATQVRSFPASAAPPHVAFHPDGTTMLNGTKTYKAESGQLFKEYLDGNPQEFSPNGQKLVGLSGNRVCVWSSARTGGALPENTYQIGPPGGTVFDVAFSPDGRYVATANANGTIYILRIAPPPARNQGASP